MKDAGEQEINWGFECVEPLRLSVWTVHMSYPDMINPITEDRRQMTLFSKGDNQTLWSNVLKADVSIWGIIDTRENSENTWIGGYFHKEYYFTQPLIWDLLIWYARCHEMPLLAWETSHLRESHLQNPGAIVRSFKCVSVYKSKLLVRLWDC